MPRRRLHVDGVVQGVGFRPFVYNLAGALGLAGWVSNSSRGVFIEVEGPVGALDGFRARLEAEAPPLSRIMSVSEAAVAAQGGVGFVIRASDDAPGTATLVPADVATCADCLRELRDPADRRFGYPFTNCTSCGPRWTIIDRIPYDRPFTSMASFEMCAACRAEYEDPRDRRFHAQPNACPACGPRLRLVGEAVAAGADPVDEAARLLAAGQIAAIKGIGGFHLAVRADDEAAVARLRRRKRRQAKPLAVMAPADRVDALAAPTDAERAALAAPDAPIVLVTRRQGAPVAPSVAPRRRRLGVMLPYAPLHHLLFDALAPHGVSALVMTSGNLGDEPICLDDDEAMSRLSDIADLWLLHDRPIRRRADDSVVRVAGSGQTVLIRRSRGIAPAPIFVRGRGRGGPPVLAAGADLKNTVALLKEDRCFVSPHVGDVGDLATWDFFRETVRTLTTLLEREPEVLACDLHPGYLSSRWARQAAAERGLPLVEVQHHHAHMVAVMTEHGLEGPCLGVILDGTGSGTDGTIWGGELLVGDRAGFARVGHLSTFALPGGDAAIRHPWRTAVSCLREAYGDDAPRVPALSPYDVAGVRWMLSRGLRAPRTSSCGRLFDAVAALCGVGCEARYEAEGAIALTAATTTEAVRRAIPLAWEVSEAAGATVIDVPTLIRGVARALRGGADVATVSARFHAALIASLAEAARRAAAAHGVTRVVLGGGSLQNEHLWTLLPEALAEAGLRPHLPRALPPNDGGICVGQAVVARATL